MIVVGWSVDEGGDRPLHLTVQRWCRRCETRVWISEVTDDFLKAARGDGDFALLCLPCAMEGIA